MIDILFQIDTLIYIDVLSHPYQLLAFFSSKYPTRHWPQKIHTGWALVILKHLYVWKEVQVRLL